MFCEFSFSFEIIQLWAQRGGAVVKVLALHTRDPIWAPVLTLAAPLPTQLPACGPGRQPRMAQGFGILHPHGIPAWEAAGFGLAQLQLLRPLGE